MADSGQEIADAIVTHLNSQEFGFGFSAESPDDPQRDINFEASGEPHLGTKCFAIPVSDSEEKVDRQGVLVTPVIHLFVSRFMNKNDGITRKTMDEFVADIRASIRFVKMAEFHWSATETVTKYDPDKLRTQDRFFSVLALSYINVE